MDGSTHASSQAPPIKAPLRRGMTGPSWLRMLNCSICPSGSAADVTKCYDALIRLIPYYVAAIAGFPMSLLHTYAAYLEGLWYFNKLAAGQGAPSRRRRSIPQGCVWSNDMLALVTLPLCRKLDTGVCIPRVL